MDLLLTDTKFGYIVFHCVIEEEAYDRETLGERLIRLKEIGEI